MAKIKASEFAKQAYLYRDSHISYSKLDCQAFVEKVLEDCGFSYNWRGSNHMWRSAVSWKGTIAEAEALFGEVPAGALLFTVKNDGGEKARGYKDTEGNAAHVGICTRLGKGAMHSSTGGVQECAFPDSKRWTHAGLLSCVEYNTDGESATVWQLIDQIASLTEELKELLSNDN